MKLFKKSIAVAAASLLAVAGLLPISAQAAGACDSVIGRPSNNGVLTLCAKGTPLNGYVKPVQGVSGKWVFQGSPSNGATNGSSVYVSGLTPETTFPLPVDFSAFDFVQFAIDANDVVYVMKNLEDFVYRFDAKTGDRLADFSLGGTSFVHIHQNRLGEVFFNTKDLSRTSSNNVIYDTGGQIRYEVDRGIQIDANSMVSRLTLSGFRLLQETFSIRSVGSSAALFYEGPDGEYRITEGLGVGPRQLYVDPFTSDVYLIARQTVISRQFQVYLVSKDSVTLLHEFDEARGFGSAVTASDGILVWAGKYFFVKKDGTVTVVDDSPAVTAGLGDGVGTNHYFSRTSAGLIGQFAYKDADGVYRFYMGVLNDARDSFDMVPHGHIGNPGSTDFNTTFGSYGGGLIMMSRSRGIMKVPNSAIFSGSAVVSESTATPNIASSKFLVGSTYQLKGENLGLVKRLEIGAYGGPCSVTGTTGCVISYDRVANRDYLSFRLPVEPGDYPVVAKTDFGDANLGTLRVVSYPAASTPQTEAEAGGVVQIQTANPELIESVRYQQVGRALIRTLPSFTRTVSGISFTVPTSLDAGDYRFYLRSNVYEDGVRIADQVFTLSITGVPISVTDLSPATEVVPGATVTITGSGLESAKRVYIVTDNFAELVELDSVSNSQVTFTAPYLDGGPYRVVLETSDGKLDLFTLTGKAFEYAAPTFEIGGIDSNQNVLPGDLVLIEGVDLDTVEKVIIDGAEATITDQQPGKLQFAAPDVERAEHVIFVQVAGELRSTQTTLTYQPRELNISGIAPVADVEVGDSVTITGLMLDTIDEVMVGELAATITAQTATSLTFTAPQQSRARYGISVKIGLDTLATDYELTYKPISVGETAVQAPEEPEAGDSVTVTGEGLDRVEEVLIGGVPAQVVNQDDGSVTVILPEGQDGSQEVVFIIDGEEVPANVAINYGGFVIDTAFKAWTKRLNDGEAKIYAKNPVGLGKIVFKVNGEEIAWVRAVDMTDPKLRVITEGPMRGASYLVRTVDLKPGKNALEVYLDGERILRTAYSIK